MGGCCTTVVSPTPSDMEGKNSLRRKEASNSKKNNEANNLLKDDDDDEEYEHDSNASDHDEQQNENNDINREQLLETWQQSILDKNESLAIWIFDTYSSQCSELISHVFPDGNQALQIAIKTQLHRLLVALLTEKVNPVDVNYINPKLGNNALHYASQLNQYSQVVALLLTKGCNPNLYNKEGLLPIDIAHKNYCYHNVEILQPHSIDVISKREYMDTDSESILEINPNKTQLQKIPSQQEDSEDDYKDEKKNENDENNNQNNHQKLSMSSSAPISNDVITHQMPRLLIKTKSILFAAHNQGNTTLPLDGNIKSYSSINHSTPYEKALPNNVSNDDEYKKQMLLHAKQMLSQNTSRLLLKMEEIDNLEQKLPKLMGFLEKKNKNFISGWQTQWVVMQDTHMLWNAEKINVQDVNSFQERKKFKGHINILGIRKVLPNKKHDRVFVIKALDPKRDKLKNYEWKAPTKKDRDIWVEGIGQYILHTQHMVNYVSGA